MQPSPLNHPDVECLDIATFYVRGSAYGIDLLKIREINKLLVFTPVPGAPDLRTGDIEPSRPDRYGHRFREKTGHGKSPFDAQRPKHCCSRGG